MKLNIRAQGGSEQMFLQEKSRAAQAFGVLGDDVPLGADPLQWWVLGR